MEERVVQQDSMDANLVQQARMEENLVQQDRMDENLVDQDRADEILVQQARLDEKGQGNNAEEMTSTEEVISPEETLLHCARRGQKSIVEDLLKSAKEGKVRIDINCKGKDKGKRGYSALHLAAYFGHKDVVKLLLQNNADVDILNNEGDTPLHKAVYTGRESTVMVLLEHYADVSIRNAEGQTPKDVSQNKQIRKVLEAAETHELIKIKEEFLNSARLGDVTKVQEQLNDPRLSSINCQDEYGNTALHLAAQSGQKEVAICLLKSGIDSNLKNKNGLRAEELVQSTQMKQLLAVKPVKAFFTLPHRCEGMLLKKSNFLGWKPHWVLLERGVLSYFKNRGDATSGTKRRGMKYLDEARIFITQDNPFEFLINFSDGAEHRLSTDLDTYSSKQMERQKWTNAFKEHIEYSTHYIHKGEVIDEEKEDIVSMVTLQESLKVAKAHQTTLENQIKLVSQMIDSHNANRDLKPDMLTKIKLELHHMSASSRDMCTSLNQCLTLFVQQEEIRQKELTETSEKCRVLEEALHALALEHHELEKTYSEHTQARYYSTDDDEFYDCDEGSIRSRALSRSYNSEDFDETMSYKSAKFDCYMKENQSQDNSNQYHVDLQGRSTFCPITQQQLERRRQLYVD